MTPYFVRTRTRNVTINILIENRHISWRKTRCNITTLMDVNPAFFRILVHNLPNARPRKSRQGTLFAFQRQQLHCISVTPLKGSSWHPSQQIGRNQAWPQATQLLPFKYWQKQPFRATPRLRRSKIPPLLPTHTIRTTPHAQFSTHFYRSGGMRPISDMINFSAQGFNYIWDSLAAHVTTN